MLSTLNVRSSTHNSCEDNLFVRETEDSIVGIVADGCSSGVKSFFASQLLCYSFAKNASEGIQNATSDIVVKSMMDDIDSLRLILNLTEYNFLSTAILFHYYKDTKRLRVRHFGDGFYSVNGMEYILDQDNTPDYMAYHTDNQEEYLLKYPGGIYDGVGRFMIASDGIDRIERSQFAPDPKSKGYMMLYDKPTSDNYLARMWNILKNDHYFVSDDLSIISYHD